ncbi:hypothetical protein ACS0TY_035283 [Phlomoides rotata]
MMKRNAIEGKVTTLQKLVPNCESEGVEGLFREIADYIMALEMRVKVMQIMVDLLSGCDDGTGINLQENYVRKRYVRAALPNDAGKKFPASTFRRK